MADLRAALAADARLDDRGRRQPQVQGTGREHQERNAVHSEKVYAATQELAQLHHRPNDQLRRSYHLQDGQALGGAVRGQDQIAHGTRGA